MATIEKLIALGMDIYRPFRSLDSTTGKFVETGTILTCHKLSGKDDFKDVYFVVEGNNLYEMIIDSTDGYELETVKINDIVNYFKAGILLKIYNGID